MTGIRRSARQVRWKTLSRHSSSASPRPRRNSSVDRRNGEHQRRDDRVARRVVGEECAVVVEARRRCVRVGLEQAVVEEAVGDALAERPDRDGEHVEDRRRAEHEQEELAAAREGKPRRTEAAGPWVRPPSVIWSACASAKRSLYNRLQNSFAASAWASSSAFFGSMLPTSTAFTAVPECPGSADIAGCADDSRRRRSRRSRRAPAGTDTWPAGRHRASR